MDGAPPDFRRLNFFGRDYPEDIRVDVWSDVIGRKLLKVAIDPPQRERFQVDAKLRILPGLRFGIGTFSPSVNTRSRQIVAKDNDDFVLLVNLSGEMDLSQNGRELSLKPGDASFMACSDQATYVRRSTGRVLCGRIPRAALSMLASNPYDTVAKIVPQSSEVLKFLTFYLETLEDHALSTTELRTLAVRHVHDLANLMLGAKRDAAFEAQEGGLRAARMLSVRNYIAENLQRQDLSIDQVAAQYQISSRQLQRHFEADGVTFSECLQLARLDCAHRMLCDSRKADMSIGEIIFASGFGDVSHFNRVFRKHFGASPSDVRNGRSPR